MFPPVIDNTMMSKFTNCPLAFYRAFVQNKTASTTNVHLHAGGAFAKSLEAARNAFYRDHLSQEDSESIGLKTLIETYGDFDHGDSAKSLDRMCGAFEFYCSQWPFAFDHAKPAEINGKPAVEWSFAIPLPVLNPDTNEPIIFSGRADTVDTMVGGLYIHDDKTTSSLGASWGQQWDLRGQFIGYAWAAREHGLKTKGTIIRGVSILKTKYDKAEALVSQPDWKIDRWYESFLFRLNQLIAAYKSNYFHPVFDEACNHYGGCEFRQLCLVQDPEPWMAQYGTRNWNPLERK